MREVDETFLYVGVAFCFSVCTSISVASKSSVTCFGAKPTSHTRARAVALAVSIRARSSSSILFSSRHAVGCEATGPNNAGWSRNGARSEEYPPPSAAITARSTSNRPGS
jgi:hypothetical protein